MYSYFIPSDFIFSTHSRVVSTFTARSSSPCTTITGVFLIFTRSSGLDEMAGAAGAMAAHNSECLIPRYHVPPPPMEWPIKYVRFDVEFPANGTEGIHYVQLAQLAEVIGVVLGSKASAAADRSVSGPAAP